MHNYYLIPINKIKNMKFHENYVDDLHFLSKVEDYLYELYKCKENTKNIKEKRKIDIMLAVYLKLIHMKEEILFEEDSIEEYQGRVCINLKEPISDTMITMPYLDIIGRKISIQKARQINHKIKNSEFYTIRKLFANYYELDRIAKNKYEKEVYFPKKS